MLPPLVATAVNVTAVPVQIVVSLATILTVGVTGAVTLTVMVLDSAVALVTQVALLVSCALTTSPLANVVLLNVFELPPTVLPFTIQVYTGAVPPWVDAAVNVMVLPLHIEVVLAVMLTVGVTGAVIFTVTALDVAVAGCEQAAEPVNSQVTTSPFAKLLALNVAVLLPTLLPFTFHW